MIEFIKTHPYWSVFILVLAIGVVTAFVFETTTVNRIKLSHRSISENNGKGWLVLYYFFIALVSWWILPSIVLEALMRRK